jgi:hypothetical protein
MSSLSDSSEIQGYRFCEEDFEPGFVDQATADHLPKLAPDKQKAEIAIREADRRGPSRAIATFVFERLEIAKRLLNETKGKHLFKLSIIRADVLHRADLRIYDEIVKTLESGKNAEDLIREFWAGVERPDPRIELSVLKATVIRKIVDANR